MELQKILGKGLYSIPDASRILGISQEKIRRWVFGSKSFKPIINSDYNDLENYQISFRNLIEVFFVNCFSNRVSFREIRIAAQRASVEMNTNHPFANERFGTCSSKIYMKQFENSSEQTLTRLRDGQYMLFEIFDKCVEYVEFNKETHFAQKYYPLKDSKLIVLDPQVNFGAPTITGTRILTETIYLDYEAGIDEDEIKFMYNLSSEAVQNSIKYQKSLKKAS